MKIKWNEFHLYGDIGRRQEIPVENPQEEVANFILGNGHGIAAYDLAQKIYNDKGDVEYNAKEAAVIKGLQENMRTAFAVALKEVIED